MQYIINTLSVKRMCSVKKPPVHSGDFCIQAMKS